MQAKYSRLAQFTVDHRARQHPVPTCSAGTMQSFASQTCIDTCDASNLLAARRHVEQRWVWLAEHNHSDSIESTGRWPYHQCSGRANKERGS